MLLGLQEGVKTASAAGRGKTKREDWRLCFRRATIASPASPQGLALMVSISIRGLPGLGNLYSHCQAFFNHLHRPGELCQLAWTSPCFHCLVPGNFPVHPRFLMKSHFLMRMALTQFDSSKRPGGQTPSGAPLIVLSRGSLWVEETDTLHHMN